MPLDISGAQFIVLKKNSVIIFLAFFSVIAFGIYLWSKTPEGVIPMSDQAERIAQISLWTSVVALLTAIVGLIEKIIGLKKADKGKSE